jgi:hypothetical protein
MIDLEISGGTVMHIKRTSIITSIVAAILLSVLALPMSVQAKPPAPRGGGNAGPVSCNLPESNAESLEILSNYYPGYWWDHTDITIAVQAAPNVDAKYLRVIHEAIATWSEVLDDCFDGAITLTDVTVARGSQQKAADIVLHYVPTAGGASFDGYAICGDHGCPNILVRSDVPQADDYSPEYVGWVTLHEVGHALGLGHATNLLESTDLMGYGWPDLGDPVLSDCDLDAIAFVFAWVFEGSAPHPPAEGPYDCSAS